MSGAGGGGAPPAPPLRRLALVGMGLIGASLARCARERGLAAEVVACDADPAVLERARALGLADRYEAGAAEAARGADLVIACVPVGASGAVAAALAPGLSPGAVVSDAGSVKGAVIRAMAPHLPAGVHLVPAHPIAGTENSGPDAGFGALFQDRWCVLTPPEGTDAGAVALVRAFWEGCGARVETMTAERHDRVLAITSHLPHLIAYTIVGTAADLEEVDRAEVIKFSASGFRDFTRIAASDPTMWRDVFLANKGAVLELIGRFSEDLALLARAIRWDDGDALHDLFTRTRAIRRGVIEAGQDTAAPDFGRRAGEAVVPPSPPA